MADYTDKDGNVYTEDFIKSTAEENGISFDDVLSFNGLSTPSIGGPGKKSKSAEKSATADVKNTVSKSAKPSSASQDNPFSKTDGLNEFLGIDELVKPAKTVASVKSASDKSIREYNPKTFANQLGEKIKSKDIDFIEAGGRRAGLKNKSVSKEDEDYAIKSFSGMQYEDLSPEQKIDINNVSSRSLLTGSNPLKGKKIGAAEIESKSKEILDSAAATKDKFANQWYIQRAASGLAKGLNYVGESIASMPETAYSVMAIPQNAYAYASGDKRWEASPDKFDKSFGTSNPIMDYFIEEQNDIKKGNDIYDNANYDSVSITQNIKDRNYLDAFALIGTGLAESAPMSAAFMVGGANFSMAKLAAISTAAMAGPATREIREENPGNSEIGNTMMGLGMAGAESVFSSITGGSLGKVYGDIVRKEGVEIGQDIFKKGLVVAYQTAIKKYGAPIAMLGEGIEEVATTVTQNLIKGKPALEGAMDSFILGVAGGGVWGSPVSIAKGIESFKDGVVARKVNIQLKDSEAGTAIELFNPNTPVTEAQIAVAVIPGANKILNSQIENDVASEKITKEEGEKIKEEFNMTYSVANQLNQLDLSASDKVKTTELLKERVKLVKVIKSIGDPTLTKSQNNKVQEINSQIESVIGEAKSAKYDNDIKLDVERAKVAIDKLGLSNDTDFIPVSNEAEALAFFEANPLENEISAEQMADYSKSPGTFVKLKTGRYVAIVNKQAAKASLLFTTGQHEVLHGILSKAFGSNPELQEKAGVALQAYIKDLIGKDATSGKEFNERMAGYSEKLAETQTQFEKAKESIDGKLEDGSINKEKYDSYLAVIQKALDNKKGDTFEETITLLSEALSRGDIKYNETVFVKIGDLIRNLLQDAGIINIRWDSGKDVFNFVRDYNKSFEKGKFNKAFKDISKNAKSTTDVSLPKASLSIDDRMSNLEDKLSDDGDIEYFEKEMAKLEYEEEFGVPEPVAAKNKTNASDIKPKKDSETKVLSKEEIEAKEIIRKEKGSISSDKVQSIYETKGVDGAFDIIQLFKPITKKIVDKRRDAPGFDRELLMDEVETGEGGILYLIKKYNPDKGAPLAAYINKYLPVRAITASRRVLDSQFNKDASEEVGLTATETADQNVMERAEEKPKYKNAIDLGVFGPAVVESAKKKLLTILRTLGSRIDAPISMNRTVTPLIAEIRDNVGKQIDIDIKTAMGGKKDNQLKNWSIQHKKYVLENMTTTFLMGLDGKGGIPQAIQKRIDGKWTNFPDWVGKKIDRESVSTDNAGRTSGAELSRRLPNVNNNISNEVFLSQILEPGGNPIRGRKEALAKAVAEEFAFDIISNDLTVEGELYQALSANQTRQGAEIAENTIVQMIKQMERGNVKLSEKIDNSVNTIIERLTDAKAKNRVLDLWGGMVNIGMDTKEWADLKEAISKDTDVNMATINILVDDLFNAGLIAAIQAQQAANAGDRYEKGLQSFLNKVTKKSDIKISKNIKGDIVVKISGKEYLIEVKLNVHAQFSSLSLKNLFKDGKFNDEFTLSKNLGTTALYEEFIRDQKIYFNNILGAIEEASKQTGIKFETTRSGNITIPNSFGNTEERRVAMKELINYSKYFMPNNVFGSLDYKNASPEIFNSLYKDVGLIQIGGTDSAGLYAIGGKNNQSISDKRLVEGITPLDATFNYKTRYDRKVDTIYFRMFPNVEKINTKTNLSLDNTSGLMALITNALASASSAKQSQSISQDFNQIIEDVKGMENYKVFSDIVAKRRGSSKNKYDFYVPPAAQDFELLLYNFMGKGKEGEAHQKFFSETLIKPYADGIILMDNARQSIKNDYKALLKAFPGVSKKIEKLTPDGDFTIDQALRVAIWNGAGTEIPGLSERDTNKLVNLVNSDPKLLAFKEGMMAASRQDSGWMDPSSHWDADTIVSDLYNLTEGKGRKQFLSEFIDNASEVFGKWEAGKLVGPNMNKIEAVYGTNVRVAIEDVVYRMSNGKNRSYGGDSETSAWSSWVNGSVGTIMFLNTRSAALQLTSAVNFLNFRDNNPIAAAAAFANQKQYWSDFATIFNSSKLKERRGGLKDDIQAAEIANAVRGSQSKAKALTAYLLKLGYAPTQIADSFAISAGGAPFYRNRIKTYLKEGKTEAEAETLAWADFSKVSDETQQSGDPKDISKQQASAAGRLVLAFQNTTMQQARSVKKSYLDLRNGRGDAKTHISKIVYYLAIQNIIFSSLQNGLFALAFDDDDEEALAKKKEEKSIAIANGVLDSVLRGAGVGGAIVATLKNVAKKYLDEKDKNYKADYAKVVLEAANISPPIGSKLRKMYSGMQQSKYDKDLIEARGWGVMQDGRVHLGPMYNIAGLEIEAITNVPMSRLATKVENISQVLNSENQAWQRVTVGLGWTPWSVGIENKADNKIEADAKGTRKEEGKVKSKETRAQKKIEEIAYEKVRVSKLTKEQLASEKVDSIIDRRIKTFNSKETRKKNKRIKDSINAVNIVEKFISNQK